MDFTKGTQILELENKVELFIEHITEKPHLVICGGGTVKVLFEFIDV